MTISGNCKNMSDICETVTKIPKAHSRSIVDVEFVKDPLTATVYLVTCANDSMKFWKTSNINDWSQFELHQEIKGWRCGVQSFDITHDGKLAVVVGVESTLHQIITDLEEKRETVENFNIGLMEIWHVCIIPNKTHYLTVSFSGSLTLLGNNGEVIKSTPFNGVRQISAIVCSPNGELIAVANNEGVVIIINAATFESKFFFEAHAVKVRALCFSPNSEEILTGSDDKIVKLYAVKETKAQFKRNFCGHRDLIMSVKFSHDRDGQIFGSCSNDGSVILWNVSNEHPLHVFREIHDGIATSFAFSFDMQFLISVGEDRLICVHRISKGKMEEYCGVSYIPENVYGEFSANTPVNYQPLSSPVYDSNGQDHLNGTNRNQYHQKEPSLTNREEEYGDDELMAIAKADAEAADFE
ncbi:unnamed protein product [Dracunculus medinensis]|uniref:WD_REPEATS_REGION domain-containing protein n=1 Tax=Dracunculus medinensis TaxID=318479 RepID=A0A0N4UCZ4_DRAME|nr:unnamed protein product [Dracunculus medinensis]